MKPELLAPVGNRVMLRATIDAGADSIYFGVKQLNMRANAKNFELSELGKVVDECHKNKVKAYLTVNTIVYEDEVEKVKKVLKEAKKAKVDAVICWDFSVINECKKLKLPFHVSTQASISNFESAKRFYKLGAERVILARELSLEQIKKIKDKIKKEKLNLEVECFVHGAMCVSVSGRCFISQHLFGRSANRGDCLQPCRREYGVTDEEGNKLKLGNHYVMSPKDLCALPILNKLVKAGIDCFKIEGRNRSPEYVKTVVGCYRNAINKKLNEKEIKKLIRKLKTVYNRESSTGFYLGKPTADDFTNLYGSAATQTKKYIGFVRNYYNKVSVAEIKIESNSFKAGDSLMFQGNKTGVHEQMIKSIELNHKKIKSGKKGQSVAVKTNKVVRENDKVFVTKPSS